MGRDCLRRLFGTQRASLEAMRESQGLFGLLAVSAGKTILSLASQGACGGRTPAVMLLPKGQLDQTIAECRWAGGHLRVPRLYVVRAGGEVERAMTDAEEPCGTDVSLIMYLLPYSVLQQPEQALILDRLKPRLIVADRTAATTKRVLRYLADNIGEVTFIIWSGTLTDRSLMEIFHLAAFALREGSPLPLDVAVAASWAECFDAGKDASYEVGAFADYLKPDEDPREGLQRRIFRTPGVIASFEASSELLPPLRFVVEDMEVSAAVRDAVKKLEASWTTPGGEELTMATEVWQAKTELLCGFYYRWVWAPGTTAADAEEWMDARCRWHRKLEPDGTCARCRTPRARGGTARRSSRARC